MSIFAVRHTDTKFYETVAKEILGSEYLGPNKENPNLEDWSNGSDGQIFHLSVLGSDSPFNGISSYLQSWFGIGRIMQAMSKKKWHYQTDGLTYQGFIKNGIAVRKNYPEYRFRTWKRKFNMILEVALLAVRKEV